MGGGAFLDIGLRVRSLDQNDRTLDLSPDRARLYSLPTTWVSTCDIWSWGLNSTILTASSTTTV